MSEKQDVSVFPVTGWRVGPLLGHDVILMQFHFITSTLHPLDESQDGILYGITPDMARALIIQLEGSIESFRTSQIYSPDETNH
ncbi:bssS family protein [Rouxiella sp. WC2420]|uniref:BssS family protein n=1 Tax=Rouxiella sp. WC2420 TaxID=3234145 RepID=A0AB39VNP0_9GAMM